MTRFILAGIRHVHVKTLAEKIHADPCCELVGIYDRSLRENFGLSATIGSEEALWRESFDVLGVGEAYGLRGALVRRALEHGKHVISDKPLCTNLAELDVIERLAREKNLKVGCMLDLRENPNVRTAHALIAAGELGDVQSIQFSGQHPLCYGTRPEWYFEKGMHGGTLNDIAVHALDLSEYLTGSEISSLEYARTWNAFARAVPHFKDGAQLVFQLANGCGCTGEVSYFAPTRAGYTLNSYWRFLVAGEKGELEFNWNTPGVRLTRHSDETTQIVPGRTEAPSDLESFLAELRGESPDLSTSRVLRIARRALELEELAAAQSLR